MVRALTLSVLAAYLEEELGVIQTGARILRDTDFFGKLSDECN